MSSAGRFGVVVVVLVVGFFVARWWFGDRGAPMAGDLVAVDRAPENEAASDGWLADEPAVDEALSLGKRRRPPRFVVSADDVVGETSTSALVPGPNQPDRKGARDVFRDEVRDPNWAPRMEDVLGPRIAAELKRLIPGFSMTDIECRSTSCRFAWEPNADVDRLRVMRLAALLYGSAAGGGGAAKNELVLVYQGPTMSLPPGDPNATLAAAEQRRQTQLRKVRTHHAEGLPTDPRINVDALPAE
jgi:hypothetical protein